LPVILGYVLFAKNYGHFVPASHNVLPLMRSMTEKVIFIYCLLAKKSPSEVKKCLSLSSVSFALSSPSSTIIVNIDLAMMAAISTTLYLFGD
jgi:hypothetical protein